ncbi:MAG: DapH/DapD/GlmU-related protein [Promethearchaeota archaeon]
MSSKSLWSPMWETILNTLKQERAKTVIHISSGSDQFRKEFFQDHFDYFSVDLSKLDIKQYLKSHTGYNWDFVLIDVKECLKDDIFILSLLRPGQKIILIVPSYPVNSHDSYFESEEEIKKKFSPLVNIDSITISYVKENYKVFLVTGHIWHRKLEHIREILSKHGEGIIAPFIHPTAVIERNFVDIGERVIIMPNVVIGFPSIGAVWDENGKIVRFPQDGRVKIGNDVFIGSCVVIDRAANKDNLTEIGDRCVIGPMAHVTHNVRIGHDTMILGNSIVTGGARIGSNCMIGANSTIRHKITVGNGVVVGMGSVVTGNVPDGVIVVGNPARILGKV